MGLIILTLLVSAMAGCGLWLSIGDRLPPGDDPKWPAQTNLLAYALAFVLPVYLFIFFVIG